MSPDVARVRLQVAVEQWRIVSTERLRGGAEVSTVRVPHYADLDSIGILQLEFLDGRLQKVAFYPDAPGSYLGQLKAVRGLPLDGYASPEASSTHRHLGADVWATRDYRDRAYVGWEDPGLSAERRQLTS